MARPPVEIDKSKAASYALKPGSFYGAEVTSVTSSGAVTVFVKELGVPFGPIIPVGTTKLNKLKVKDSVVCTFSDPSFKKMIVFGNTGVGKDVFADKEVVKSLVATITSLQNQIISLNNRVTALENA